MQVYDVRLKVVKVVIGGQGGHRQSRRREAVKEQLAEGIVRDG